MKKLPKYVVIASSVGGDKVYEAGDEVDQNCFPNRRVEELEEEKFIKLKKLTPSEKAEVKKAEKEAEELAKISAKKAEEEALSK